MPSAMNRRGFLASLGMLVGGLVLEEAIPFNRVWSVPSNVVVRTSPFTTLAQYPVVYYDRKALEALRRNLVLPTSSTYFPGPPEDRTWRHAKF